METVRYTYRLRPGAQALRSLNREAGMARWVWNRCVATDRDRRRADVKPNLGGATMGRHLTGWRAEHDWLREGSSVVQQQSVRDWAQARKFVKGKGAPTFHAKRRWSPSVNYTKRGFRLNDGRLCLAGGTVVPVVWSRELPTEPSSVRVYRDTVGDWWASFVAARKPETFPLADASIGVDWGVREIATTTDEAFDLPHPQHERRSAQRRARYQRMMARRNPAKGQPGSAGYGRAKRSHAKVCRKAARQRQDTACKWARRVVEHHDRIAVEDFRPKFLARSTMARVAADAAIGATKRQLIEYARRAGRTVALVPPAYTTTDCSGCGARTKRLDLKQRTYACPSCGLVLPRDRNSARVIRARAGFDPAGVDCVSHGNPRANMQHEPGIPSL